MQLARLDEMIDARRLRAQQRSELLKDVPELILPVEPEGYRHTYYLYTCLLPEDWGGARRDELMKRLFNDYGVGSGVFNTPTYLDRPYIKKRIDGQRLPESEKLASRIVCPSLHPLMTFPGPELALPTGTIPAAVAGDTEAVERNVPDQLLPVGALEVGRDIDRNAGGTDEFRD